MLLFREAHLHCASDLVLKECCLPEAISQSKLCLEVARSVLTKKRLEANIQILCRKMQCFTILWKKLADKMVGFSKKLKIP